MKRRLKYLSAMLLFHTGLMSLCERLQDGKPGGRAVILLYHRIIPHKWKIRVSSVPEIKVDEESFESQLRFLSKSYHVISFDELTQILKKGAHFQPKTVVITFDDGWEDNHEFAWPLLKKYNLPAIIFLTTGYIGSHKIFWQERLLSLLDRLSHAPEIVRQRFQTRDAEDLLPLLDSYITKKNIEQARINLLNTLKTRGGEFIETLIGRMADELNRHPLPGKFNRRRSDASKNSKIFGTDNTFLNWEQVKEMHGPLMSYGSHGVNHILLDQAKDMMVIDELRESKKQMEIKLAHPTLFFAYPNGNYNSRTVQLLKDTGYEAAVTTEEGIVRPGDDPFLLKRINICENRFQAPNGKFSKEMFAAYLARCNNIPSVLEAIKTLPSNTALPDMENTDRYEVEKAKWDSKASDISDENDKPEVDSYDDIFMTMNTLRPIHSFFALEGQTSSALDLGCGAGWTTLLLAQKAREVHGIDISFNSIKKLNHYKSKYFLPNINSTVGDAERLPYADNCFDYVFGNASLHHLRLEKVIAEISRVLKKDGKAAFCEPFAHNPAMNFYRHIKHNCLEEFHGTDKPLNYRDKDIFSKYFSKVTFVESSFLSDNLPSLRTLEAAILKNFPFTRRFASYITILATK